jgi:outer membrane protein, heavy metal efflux system
VLRARVETTKLATDAVAMKEDQRTAKARLNSLLDRPTATPIEASGFPSRLLQAVTPDSTVAAAFESDSLGARSTRPPLPPLDSVQTLALSRSPALRAQQAQIAAQATREELTRLERKPDLDLSLQYGQRTNHPDMVTATVSIPYPFQRRLKQDAAVAEARADLAAMNAEYRAAVNDVRSETARLHGMLERDRTQLVLYAAAVIPRARASLTSTIASYQAGRSDLTSVLQTQTTLFEYEMQYYRALSDFAKTLAELEQLVGAEVLR